MELSTIQSIALVTCVALVAMQLFVKNKTTSHVLFAVFSTSVALSLTKGLAGESAGIYQYLIGMGACFTCNGYWLFARSVFRKEQALSGHHFGVAGIIAFLIMVHQGYLMARGANSDSTLNNPELFQGIVMELTILLSSCILVLSFWEGCRGFRSANKQDKAQRILFLMTFGGAVMISKVSHMWFTSDPQAQQITTTVITIFVLLNTQCLLIWRTRSECHQALKKHKEQQRAPVESFIEPREVASHSPSDAPLLKELENLMVGESLYLKPNLKMADVARLLNVSEYRVSNALRHSFKARNFNHYINQFRIQHAKSLLLDSDKQHWSVLVIGLESGFASVGPFTRAFKLATGDTPNQFRVKASKCPGLKIAPVI